MKNIFKSNKRGPREVFDSVDFVMSHGTQQEQTAFFRMFRQNHLMGKGGPMFPDSFWHLVIKGPLEIQAGDIEMLTALYLRLPDELKKRLG